MKGGGYIAKQVLLLQKSGPADVSMKKKPKPFKHWTGFS